MKKIKLGKIKAEIKKSQSYDPSKDHLSLEDEEIYINKHSWDCGWYWGLGYIGNNDLHTHASVFIHELLWHDVTEVFIESIFKTDSDFWTFKDLLKQAYALRECAEVYVYGGHCITNKTTGVIKSEEMNKRINEDLKKVLDTLWNFLEDLTK